MSFLSYLMFSFLLVSFSDAFLSASVGASISAIVVGFCYILQPSLCNSGQFQCKTSQHCINNHYICDGENDCADGSDEDTSPGSVCGKTSRTQSAYKQCRQSVTFSTTTRRWPDRRKHNTQPCWTIIKEDSHNSFDTFTYTFLHNKV